MSARSTLVVVGRVEDSVERAKIERLLLVGLVNSLSEEAPGLDVEFGQLASAFPQPTSSSEFGLCISNGSSAAKNHLIRVQFNPTVEQFRTALRESFAYALNTGRTSESDPSVDGRVSVIYTGQVIAHTGEWLLADAALAGHQVHSWLDSQAAMAWWPQLDKYPNIGDKLHVHLVVPVAGPGSSWSLDKPGHPHSILTHVDVRLVQLNLYVEGSWRFGGKPVVNNPANTESYDGIQSFVQQTIHKHPLTILNLVSNDPALGCALSAQRPALYVFPGSGLGSQGCGLFSLQGFTMLLGGSYTAENFPNWWSMVRNLPKLDAVLLPDWSAPNLLTHRFMAQLVDAGVQGSNIIGEVLIPPSVTSTSSNESASELALAPPTGTQGNMSQSPWAPNNLSSEALPPSMVLYSKLGWGELRLQPLAQRAGLVLLWKAMSPSHQNHVVPLRIVLPATQLHGATPVQGLIRLLKSMGSVSHLECRVSGTGKITSSTMKSAKPNSAIARTPSMSTRPNGPNQARTGAPPARPQTAPRLTNVTNKTTVGAIPAPKKPSSSITTNAKRPASATTTPAAAPKRSANVTTNKDVVDHSRLSSTTHSLLKSTPNGVLTKPSPPSKSASRATDKITPTVAKSSAQKPKSPSTADRLAAHANLVASKQIPNKAPGSASEKKSTAPTKKPSPPATKPAATAALKAKSPIREISEPKSPSVPQDEPGIFTKTTPAETARVATDEALQESMELAAVDPLMSGWRSMEQSLVVGAPTSGAPVQQEELAQEEEADRDHSERQPEVSVLSDVSKPPEFPPDAHVEPEALTHPQDLYKVHKFERFNEADEADLVDETQTQSSMDQEPEDLIQDHTMSHFGQPVVAASSECTDMAPSVVGDIGMDAEKEVTEQETYQIEEHEGFASVEHGEEIPSILSSAPPMDDHVFDKEDSEINGIAAARSRPPAHLGLEDEDEQESEDIPTVESPAPKAFSPTPIVAKTPEYIENTDEAHQHLHDRGKMNSEYDGYEVIAPTPESSGWNQENNELSDTSSFERHEEDAAAATAVALDERTNLSFEGMPSPGDHDGMTLKLTENLSSKSEEHLSDSLDAHEFPHADRPSIETHGDTDGAYAEAVVSGVTRQSCEEEAFSEANKYSKEASEEHVHDNFGFVSSELHPASMEIPSDSLDEHGFANVTSSTLEQEHEHNQYLPEEDEDLVHVDNEKLAEFSKSADHEEYYGGEEPEAEAGEPNAEFEPDSYEIQPQDQLHSVSLIPESMTPPLKEDNIPPFAAEPALESHTTTTEPDANLEEAETEPLKIDQNYLDRSPDDFDDHAVESHQPDSDVLLMDKHEPISPSEAVFPEPEEWSQVPGPQDDLVPPTGGCSSHDIDQDEKHFVQEVDHPQDEVDSGAEGELEEPGFQHTESDVLHTTNIEEAHELFAQKIVAHPSPSSDVEDEVTTTCQQSWSHSPNDGFPTAPVHFVEDEQSIEAHMRLKLQQEAEKLSPNLGVHCPSEKLGVGSATALHDDSDSSDVKDDMGTEVWIKDSQPLSHECFGPPLSPDALETQSMHPVVDATHLDQESIEHFEETDTVSGPSKPSYSEGEAAELADSLGTETHSNVLACLADSLEQEAADGTQFMHSTTGMVADSTTVAAEQAVSSSTQPMDRESLAGDEFEHEEEVGQEFVSRQFAEHDGANETLSIQADSTTMDNSEQQKPMLTAQVPIGFDQLLDGTDGGSDHFVQIGSPESHTSMDSVVRQQLQADAAEDVDSRDHELLVHCHEPDGDFVHSVNVHEDSAASHPVTEVSDAHTTSDEHHISDRLAHGKLESTEHEHPEDMLPTSAYSEVTEIGFIGYDHQISQNGQAMTPSSDGTHLVESQGDKPINGVHSSDHSGIHNLPSPGAEEYSNGTAPEFRPYPDEEVDASDQLHSSERLKMMPGWTHGSQGHPDANRSPTTEAWPYKTGVIPDQHNTDDVDADPHNVPYPMHESEFLSFPPGTNLFETATMGATTATNELALPSGVPTDHQAAVSDHSSIESPQPDGFDPLQIWGQPQGLPTPTLPATAPRGGRTSNTSSRPAHMRTPPGPAMATRGKSTSAVSGPTTPATLPPGSPVFMDLISVPGYLVQVPQSMAVEFFARVRARTYILSGDALHPMIGEALIEGKSKWGPNDVELLLRHASNTEEDGGICILPTDEPYEWGCWLRTPCGRINRDTGETRLQAAGFKVLPAASCCDIEFSAGSVNVRCEGVRVEF